MKPIRRRPRTALALFLLVTSLLITSLLPNLAIGAAPLTLAQALQQTLDHNPELAAFPYRVRRSEGAVLQAGVRPLPRLGLSAENVAGSGQYQGTEQAEFTLALSQLVELGGKRTRRLARAEADLRKLQAEYELARLELLATTGRRFYALLRLQALAAWIDTRVAGEQHALATIKQRARAGAVGQADVSKMALRLAGSEALQQQLAGAYELARIRLATMWLGAVTFGPAAGNLAALPPVPALHQLEAAVDAAPALLRQAALQRLATASAALAEANGRVDLRLGLGIRRLQASADEALVLEANIPLAFGNPNRGRIAAAQAERELSVEQLEWRHRSVVLALREVRQNLANQRQLALRLDNTLLPLAHTQLSETERGYQRGRYSVLQWVDAQRELYTLQRELIEARTATHLNLLELERITGAPLADLDGGVTP